MATDARTFPEIWNSLTSGEQLDLRDLILEKTKATSNTFWFWKKGASMPASRTDRRTIARVVSTFLNVNASEHTLFPRKR